MVEGFNPMRWNCDTDGCFNKKRRPKIEVFADCFPRRINFGDVDGLVEYCGMFCLLEWKGEGGTVRQGQARSYIEFTQQASNIVFVVEGDAETMGVKNYFIFWNGHRHRLQEATLDDVKTRIRGWVSWVENKNQVAT